MIIGNHFVHLKDLAGAPLNNGTVYFGVANQNPETNPVTVYWDSALTQPAAQPIKATNGYIMRDGTVANVYSTGAYSLTVKDKKGNLVYSLPDSTKFDSGNFLQTSLAASSGSSLIGFVQSGIGAINRTMQDKAREILSVKDFGAVGDGITDDTSAIQKALDASNQYQTVFFPYGTYVISNELIINSSYLMINGYAKILAKAGAQFEYMMKASSKTGIIVENLRFDANKDARKIGQTVRFMGIGFIGCIDSQISNVQSTNCLGYNGISAVGISASGQSIRCRINDCWISTCGESGLSPTKDSDAIFTSGEQNVIANCIATSCTDTGFVIESSNQSIIEGCTARLCGAGAAITNANASDKTGNIISGLTVHNWAGSVGAIQIGVPSGYAGNLQNSVIDGVTIVAETPTYGGPGSAVFVNGVVGFGEVQNLVITDLRIRGAVTQGVLIQRGTSIHILDSHINVTGDSCVQFQNGLEHRVSNCYFNGGSYGISAQNSSEVFASGNIIRNCTSNGLYAFGTSTIYNWQNIFLGISAANTAKDAGAIIGFSDITIPYSVSVTPNSTIGNNFTITATDGNAFTINNPTKGTNGQIINITVANGSAGALGVITWGLGYYKAAFTSPASGSNRTISFKYNGSVWMQIGATAADTPN